MQIQSVSIVPSGLAGFRRSSIMYEEALSQ